VPPDDAGLGSDIRKYGLRRCSGSGRSWKKEMTKADSRERMKEAST